MMGCSFLNNKFQMHHQLVLMDLMDLRHLVDLMDLMDLRLLVYLMAKQSVRCHQLPNQLQSLDLHVQHKFYLGLCYPLQKPTSHLAVVQLDRPDMLLEIRLRYSMFQEIVSLVRLFPQCLRCSY